MTDVVGVAILDGSRLLAARRAEPHRLAGQWELPGGKVEPGEGLEAAAVREVAEELGCLVEVTRALDGSSRIDDALVLRVVLARLVAGDPVPGEHDAVRWLRAGEIEEVVWAAADVPFLDRLRPHLGSPA
jgi:8-oxo-dGTP diphosphatase